MLGEVVLGSCGLKQSGVRQGMIPEASQIGLGAGYPASVSLSDRVFLALLAQSRH